MKRSLSIALLVIASMGVRAQGCSANTDSLLAYSFPYIPYTNCSITQPGTDAQTASAVYWAREIAAGAVTGSTGCPANTDSLLAYSFPYIPYTNCTQIQPGTTTQFRALVYFMRLIAKSGSSSSTAWQLTGNAGTNPTTNFIGTTDNEAFATRVNNKGAGLLTKTNTFYGYETQTGSGLTGFSSFGAYAGAGNLETLNYSTAIGFASRPTQANQIMLGTDSSSGTATTEVAFWGALSPGGGGNDGTTGQVLTSQGTGAAPIWAASSSGLPATDTLGGSTYLAGTTSQLLTNISGFPQKGVIKPDTFTVVGTLNSKAGYWSFKCGGVNAGYITTNGTNGEPDMAFGIHAGDSALKNGSYGNHFFGFDAGVFATGNLNTAVGIGSYHFGEAGSGNTFVGGDAGNTGGTGAGQKNGSDNTGIGWDADESGLIANNNTAVGALSLSGTLTSAGANNTAVGYRTLVNNTSGSNNVALGYQAGLSETTGTYNIFLNAQGGAVTGSYNILGGVGSLANLTSGQNNTALGQNTLNAVTTVSNLIALGDGAGASNTSGTGNSYIGYQAGYYNAAGIDNTDIGYNSNFRSTGGWNATLGFQAMGVNTANAASGCTAVGNYAGYNNAGTHNTYLGDSSGQATTTATNQMTLGYNAPGQGSNTVAFGNTSVSGLYAEVSSITTYSDKRFKTHIRHRVIGLPFILKLKPVTYYKDKKVEDSLRGITYANEKDTVLHSGLLAQDVEKAAKAVGYNFEGVKKDAHGVYQLAYGDLIPSLIQAIKDQQREIDELKKLIQKSSK